MDAWLQRGATCTKKVWSLADCCRLCKHIGSCNVWSYCNNPAGCGLGCQPEMHNYMYEPTLNTWNLDPEQHPARLNPQHQCLDNGAWPYQTCT